MLIIKLLQFILTLLYYTMIIRVVYDISICDRDGYHIGFQYVHDPTEFVLRFKICIRF